MDDDSSPLEPDQLDELLSAALDGELDAAAADLGLTVAEAAQRIRATPGADARRAALTRAHELFAAPPELDELLEARLRAKAVRAAGSVHAANTDARRRRRRNVMLGIGSVAAALALVVAVAAGLTHSSSSESKSTAAPERAGADALAGSSSTTTPRVHTVQLGAFTDSQALAFAAVKRDAAYATSDQAASSSTTITRSTSRNSGFSTTTGLAPLSSQTPTSPVPTNSSGKSVSSGSANHDGTTGAGATACVAPPKVAVGDPLVLRASASLSGKPVIVLVFQTKSEHVVVIEDTDCALISLQMFD